jgi:hypothetical protein
MLKCKLTKKNFFIFFIIYLIIAGWLIYILPITAAEANILYFKGFNLTSFLAKKLFNLFDCIIFIRLIFFLISILSFMLLKNIIKDSFKNSEYLYLSLFIYLITPGIFVSIIVINYATIAIFLTLLFIYSYGNNIKVLQIIALVLLFFSHTASFVVYIATMLYAYNKKDYFLITISIILLFFYSLYANYPIDGIPKGHLLQLLGIYAVIFSPLLFFAFIYTLYRLAIDNKKTLLWYIATASFLISLLLSIRQKIKVTDFTPYVIIIVPIIVEVFKNSLLIRLKEFRKSYYLICQAVIIVLLLETSVTILEYPLYKYFNNDALLIEKSIYKVPKEIKKAKKEGKECIKNYKKREENLYKFYNAKVCK